MKICLYGGFMITKNISEKLSDRFIRYVKIDTQSNSASESFPSTEKQLDLGKKLLEELKDLQLEDCQLSEHGYVTATLPANCEDSIPAIGFLAHLDTSEAMSGENVNPRIIENYDGGNITLNEKENIIMDIETFPSLLDYKGQSLIVTDGTTLLGADNKAGIAEIITAIELLKNNNHIKHGKIRIAFTPDEEIGKGPDRFDVKSFGADFAYTVDGGELGELEYENFNAASAKVYINGLSVHPGSAKNKMKNALLIANEFNSLLPSHEIPSQTEKYEGFFHLDKMFGNVERAEMFYHLRDHDMDKFRNKKELIKKCADFMNAKYGDSTVEVHLNDQYLNMSEKIKPFMHIVKTAESAMIELGITPRIIPIRGGTDGAKLSYMGLPCPNIFTGGANFHGKFEYIPIESMNKAVEVIIKIIEKYGKGQERG